MNKIWPYFKLTFSFTENLEEYEPVISEWLCSMLPSGSNYEFDSDIYYFYADNTIHESLNILQTSGEDSVTITYKFFNGSPITSPDENGLTMIWTCDINADGTLDLDSLEVQEGYIGYDTPDEDTTFEYARTAFNMVSTKPVLPDFVWAYNETYSTWMWYHIDYALELGIAGGGRYKQRLIVCVNNKIYFSQDDL